MLGVGECTGSGRVYWEWASVLGVGECTGSGRVYWEWESVLGVGECTGSGRVYWEWESVLGVGECTGSGRVYWEWESVLGVGECTGSGRVYWEWVSVLGVGECTGSGRVYWEWVSVLGVDECESVLHFTRFTLLFSVVDIHEFLFVSLCVYLSVFPVPGIIGNLQALEVLKIAAGKDCILLPLQQFLLLIFTSAVYSVVMLQATVCAVRCPLDVVHLM